MKNQRQKILFTNAGRRDYLIQFALDLEAADLPIETLVSDCNAETASLFVAPPSRTRILPPVFANSTAYATALFDLVQREEIQAVFPLSDLDLAILAEQREHFRSVGCEVIISSPATIAACNDKRQTFEFCLQHNLPTARCWFDAMSYNGSYPAIQKHILGSGSSGLKRIDSASDLKDFVVERDMLQPMVEGEEFGLDVLNDLKGDFVAVCIKRKLLMRAGETDKARVEEDAKLAALGRQISQAFRHVGNMDCDVMRDHNGALYCIDFNPRFGGGYPATHLAGYNYLKAILDMLRGETVSLPDRPLPISVMKGISLHWCHT